MRAFIDTLTFQHPYTNGVSYAKEEPLCVMLNKTIGEDQGVFQYKDINGYVQDCRTPSALAMELLQSGTKPSIWSYQYRISRHECKTV